jgi:hypothetical protein
MKYRSSDCSMLNRCNSGCTKDGAHSNGCGRGHEGVAKLNGMLKQLAAYAKEIRQYKRLC